MKFCRNSAEFIKKIVKMVFERTTSCVRGIDVSIAPRRHR